MKKMKNFLYCVYLKVSILLFISICNKIRAQSNVTWEEFSSTGEFTLKNGRTFELPNIYRERQPTLNFDINYNSTIIHHNTTWQFKDDTKSRLFFFYDGSRLTLEIKKNVEEFTTYSVIWYPFPEYPFILNNTIVKNANFEICVYLKNNPDSETFWYNTYQSVKPVFPMDINAKSTKKPFGNIYAPLNETDYAYILNQMFINTNGFALRADSGFYYVQKIPNQLCFSGYTSIDHLKLQIFTGKNIKTVTKYREQQLNDLSLKRIAKKVNFTHPHRQHFSAPYWVLPANNILTNISNLQQSIVFFLNQTEKQGLKNMSGQLELPFIFNENEAIVYNFLQIFILLYEVYGSNFRLVIPLTQNYTQLSLELENIKKDYYFTYRKFKNINNINDTKQKLATVQIIYKNLMYSFLSGNLEMRSLKNLTQKNSINITDMPKISSSNFSSFFDQVLIPIVENHKYLDFYFKTLNNGKDFVKFYAHPNEYNFFDVFDPNDFVLDLNWCHTRLNENTTVPSSLISQMAFNAQDSPAFLQLTGNIDGQQSSEEMLRSIVASALTASIGGYSWLVPYRVGTVGRTPLTEELYIRWVQAVALMPKMAFHTPPWEVGPRAVEATRTAIALHQSLEEVFVELAKVRVAEGHPLIRPLWYEAPDDANTYAIDDQFMLGDRFLVAPVLYVAQRSRLVYLPEGNWTEVSGSSGRRVYQGGRWRRFSAPLERLLYFKKVE